MIAMSALLINSCIIIDRPPRGKIESYVLTVVNKAECAFLARTGKFGSWDSIAADLAPFAEQVRKQLAIERLSVVVDPAEGYYTVSFKGWGKTTKYQCTCSAKDARDACTPVIEPKLP